MHGMPRAADGKEAVTQNLDTKAIHRSSGEVLDGRIVKDHHIEWVMTLGRARLGFIDITLAERTARWPVGVRAGDYKGPRYSRRNST